MPRKPAASSAAQPAKVKTDDLELTLMRQIWRKLTALDPIARSRVCAYLEARCDEPEPKQALLPFPPAEGIAE